MNKKIILYLFTKIQYFSNFYDKIVHCYTKHKNSIKKNKHFESDNFQFKIL